MTIILESELINMTVRCRGARIGLGGLEIGRRESNGIRIVTMIALDLNIGLNCFISQHQIAKWITIYL